MPLARGFMEYAHKGLPADNWKPPAGLKTAPAFTVRSHVGIGSVEPSPSNDLYPSWYVGGSNRSSSRSQIIDKVSNKVATNCTPAAAKEYAVNSNAAFWNVDIFKGGRANIGSSSSGTSSTSSSNATDDVHSCNDSPPTVSLTAPSNCVSSCTITATVTAGTHPLSDERYAQYPGTVTISLNGQTLYSTKVTDSPSTVSFQYTPTSTGSGTLKDSVTDSVLYAGADSTTLTYSTPPVTAPTPEQTNSGSNNGNNNNGRGNNN